jgi:hypothetical protein
LTWNKPSDAGGGVRSYRIQRAAKSSGPWRTVATLSAKKFTYRKKRPVAGSYYEVQGVNEAGYGNTTMPVKPRF